MTTSGVYTWDPTLANLIEEAAERAGINPETLTHQHLVSARNSLNYLFRELEADQIDRFYRQDQESTSVSSGTSSVNLASGSVEVLRAWYRESGQTTDIQIARVSREDYKAIPTKTTSGNPSLYWINHEALNAPAMVLWPVPNATITLYYDRVRYIDDATTLSHTSDAHRLWFDVLAYGLAVRMAEKWNEAKVGYLAGRFAQTKATAGAALVPRGPVMIYGVAGSRARTRRA